MTIVVFKLVALVVIGKGLVMAVLLVFILPDAALSDFEKGLIIAATSAAFTGIFTVIAAVLAARIAGRATAPIHQDVKDVKHKLNADRRESDQPSKENQ